MAYRVELVEVVPVQRHAGVPGQSVPTGAGPFYSAPRTPGPPPVVVVQAPPRIVHSGVAPRGPTAFGTMGNLVWIVLGGAPMALSYFVSGLALCCTIVGIPFGVQCFKLGAHAFLPFDHQAVDRGRSLGSGCLGLPFNIVWLLFFGWPIALGHVLFALLCALTVVGIPFAVAHLRLAGLALWPFGKEIDGSAVRTIA